MGRKWMAMGAGAVVGVGALSGVALAGANAIPVCEDDSEQITQDTALEASVAPLCSDADEDELIYSLGSNDVANGTLEFDEVTGEFTYTPDAGFVGTDDFTFVANDQFVIPQAADDDVHAAEISEEALFTITVAAQVTTTTSTTVAVVPSSTATSVLARTGVDNATTAGGALAAIALGGGLVFASGVLVTRARRQS